jgi:hypothetical protein
MTSSRKMTIKYFILIKFIRQKQRDNSYNQGVDGRMGSEWILGRLDGGI